jgi:hypothetical protein
MQSWKFLLPLLASTVCFAVTPDRIPGPIDSSQMITLPGSVYPKARPQYDQGPVEPSLRLGYVTLQISPSASQQTALDELLAEQQDRSSPNYHKWLTPEQYAARFGLSRNDGDKITAWLQGQGFTVVSFARGRNAVVFSGSAAQIQSAFRTEIHRYQINAESHIANSTPVQIPVALGGIVTGIRGLHDFRPKPMFVRPVHADNTTNPHPSYTSTQGTTTQYFLAPGDIATIYDVNALYDATPTPINGAGLKLAIMGQTDIYLADLVDFRTDFDLPSSTCTTGPTGLITSCPDSTPTNPSYLGYVLLGTDPGSPSLGDLFESDLDVEWSGAVAPNAQIIFVNAETENGVFDALTYAIDNAIAPVMSMSYSECEEGGANLETALQQGNAEGITIMNSAGDSGSAACDDTPPGTSSSGVFPSLPYSAAQFGLDVGYPASSPEVTGVGGTSFPYPTYYKGTYWNTSNGSTGGSALQALEGKEASWNDDVAFVDYCASQPSNTFCTQGGSTKVSGWVDLTTAEAAQEDIWISIGGGGVSNCFNQNADGVCLSGFTRPSWQQAITIPGLTSPQSTYRFVPDVSLLASPNFPGYILCTPVEELSSTSPYDTETASSCAGGIASAVDGVLSGNNYVVDPSLVGGTSASSPVFAGIVTLINQYLGSSGLGNINPTLYALAATPSNDYFHHVTSGDNDVYCQVGSPSGQPTDVICPSSGVVGFSASNFDSTGHTGYNLVTGLGSVDANNLAAAWLTSRTTTSSISLSGPSSSNVYQGSSVSFSVAVTPSTAVGAVSFSTLNNGTTTVLGTVQLNTPPSTNASATFSTASLPAGSNSVTATYLGDSTHTGSTSSSAAVVTVVVPFAMSASPSTITTPVPAGQSASSVITITPASGFTGTVNFTNSTASSAGSCTAGLPAGALCSFSPSSVTLNGSAAATVNLTITTAANMAVPSGPQTITVTGSSGGAAISTPVSLTIAPTNQTFTLTTTAATFSISPGAAATVNIAVTGTNGFVSSSTTALPLTYSCSGSPSLSAALISCEWSPANGQAINAAAVTLKLQTTAPTSELRSPLGRARGIVYALLLPGLFGIVFLGGPRTRRMRLLSLIAVLGISTLGLGSCGGGGSNSSQNNPGTPAGNYKVTITAATAGPNVLSSTTPALTITLTVN